MPSVMTALQRMADCGIWHVHLFLKMFCHKSSASISRWRNVSAVWRSLSSSRPDDLDLSVTFKYGTSTKAKSYDREERESAVGGKSGVNDGLRPKRLSNDGRHDGVGPIPCSAVKSEKNHMKILSLRSQDLLEIEQTTPKASTLSVEHRSKAERDFDIEGEIVFGINPVEVALDVKRRRFYRLYVKRSSAVEDRRNPNQRLMKLEAQAKDLNLEVVKVSAGVLNKLSGNRPHQGVCLDAGQLSYAFYVPGQSVSSTEENHHNQVKECQSTIKLWVLLDRIQDPMNLGAILRSSYYFGVDQLFTVDRDTCGLTPVVSKASSGVMEVVVVYQLQDPVEFLRTRKREGWSIVGTATPVVDTGCDDIEKAFSLDGRVVHLDDFIWPNRTILLIGNEGNGVASKLLDLCDRIVIVAGTRDVHPNIQSLNVSVATGIILHSFFSGMQKATSGSSS